VTRRKKLIAGIVITGGGSQLKHLKQVVEYITGMDTRIGYPNEHLAGNSSPEIASPMYATAVGLLMGALEIQEIQAKTKPEIEQQDTDDTPAQENEASKKPKKGGLLGIFLNKAKNIFDELAD